MRITDAELSAQVNKLESAQRAGFQPSVHGLAWLQLQEMRHRETDMLDVLEAALKLLTENEEADCEDGQMVPNAEMRVCTEIRSLLCGSYKELA